MRDNPSIDIGRGRIILITRGRKKVFIVGEPAAWGMAVRNAESKLRCTHLREKILRPGDTPFR